jgi:hypothetical protein
MFSAAWKMLKDTVLAFINDEALSRGAAIAFYTVTSIGPVLLIVIAIAGLAFGQDAAQNALTAQLSGLMGHPCERFQASPLALDPCDNGRDASLNRLERAAPRMMGDRPLIIGHDPHLTAANQRGTDLDQ